MIIEKKRCDGLIRNQHVFLCNSLPEVWLEKEEMWSLFKIHVLLCDSLSELLSKRLKKRRDVVVIHSLIHNQHALFYHVHNSLPEA